MGIFVGNAAERAAFKASGTKLAKGVIQKGSQIPQGATGLLSKIGTAVGAARVKIASTLLLTQAKANQQAAAQIKPTGVGVVDKVTDFIKKNPATSALIGGTALLGAGAIGYAVGKKKSTKKKSTKKKSSTRKKSTRKSSTRRSTKRRGRRSYGSEAQYKRKGGLDVKYTKNGQPYVIQSNGRARFIKRSR